MIGIGDACESYQLQIPLAPAERAGAAVLQGQLTAMIDGSPVSLPSESLHVTVFPFVDADETGESKGAIWAAEGTRWNAALDAILATTPSFTLHFREARLLGGAVVALAESSTLKALRERITIACAVPGRAFRRMDIVHVSLFRYGADRLPPSFAPIPITLDVVVNHLRLVRENVYPSLDVTVLRAFRTQLGAPSVADAVTREGCA